MASHSRADCHWCKVGDEIERLDRERRDALQAVDHLTAEIEAASKLRIRPARKETK